MKQPTPSEKEVAEFADLMRVYAKGIEKAKKAPAIIATFYTAKELKELSWSHLKRRLSALAVAALEAGYPICTGDAGYWYAAEPEDFQPTIGLLRTRAFAMLERAARLEALRDRMTAGQLPLPCLNCEP